MITKRHDQIIGITFGYTTWTFFGLSIAVVIVYLLQNASRCESIEFCSTEIFSSIFSSCLLMMIFLAYTNNTIGSKLRGDGSIKLFFMRDVKVKDLLIYVPMGLGGVFLSSYIAVQINLPYMPFVGIFLSGMVMLYAFYKTNSIIIPILIHGIYNGAVVFLRSTYPNSFLSTAPTFVPTLGINLGQVPQLASEILFQLVLVAVAEEMFKVFLISLFLVATKGRFTVKKGWSMWFAGIISVIIWDAFHSVIAVPTH